MCVSTFTDNHCSAQLEIIDCVSEPHTPSIPRNACEYSIYIVYILLHVHVHVHTYMCIIKSKSRHKAYSNIPYMYVPCVSCAGNSHVQLCFLNVLLGLINRYLFFLSPHSLSPSLPLSLPPSLPPSLSPAPSLPLSRSLPISRSLPPSLPLLLSPWQ